MFEVLVKKLKKEKLAKMISFLMSLSDEVCFSSYHTYNIDEDTSIEILNEYKQRCKDRHRQLKDWYNKEEPFFMKVLSKLGVKSDDDFEDYSNQIFENDMSLAKKMDEALLLLQKEEATRDYKEVFPLVSESLKHVETHLFDSVSASVIPIDYVIYKADEKLLFELMKMESFHAPFMKNKDKKVILMNPVFVNSQEAFAVINNAEGTLTMVVDDKDYKEFKKLKIRHKKDFVSDEKEQVY